MRQGHAAARADCDDRERLCPHPGERVLARRIPTVFPKGKHDDQVDSTAQFLDWFKKPFPGQGIFEFYRMRAERRQNPDNRERYRVRLLAPPGIGSVYTFSRRTINVGPDGTIEMSADDAQYLIRA